MVELIYALFIMGCINYGRGTIKDLGEYIGKMFNIEIKNISSTYLYMKTHKVKSRTDFLDTMAQRLNERMDKDDQGKAARTR